MNKSWIPYIVRAVLFGFLDTNTKYDAIAMRIYKIVQTIGNSQLGGVKIGLLIKLKVFILFCVRSADILPIVSGIIRHVIKVFHWIFKKSPLLSLWFNNIFIPINKIKIQSSLKELSKIIRYT